MHIPNHFLDTQTSVTCTAIAVVGVGVALWGVRRTVPAKRVPLIGLVAAFIFAAQMINFPVAGGTSGHLIGGALAAILLGPSAAVLIMTSVLVLQCLLFADGGLATLGANVLNMGLIAPVVGYGVYRMVCRFSGSGLRGILIGTALGAWCSTVVASVVCAVELAMSGSAAWGVVLPAMVWIHVIIGIGEGLITTAVVAVAARRYSGVLLNGYKSPSRAGIRELLGYGGLASLGLGICIAPFACGWPDGLEVVAEKLGIGHLASEVSLIPSPFADYTTPYVSSEIISTGIAGFVGTVIAFVLAYILARAITPQFITGKTSGQLK